MSKKVIILGSGKKLTEVEILKHLSLSILDKKNCIQEGNRYIRIYQKSNPSKSAVALINNAISEEEVNYNNLVDQCKQHIVKLLRSNNLSCPTLESKGYFSKKEMTDGFAVIFNHEIDLASNPKAAKVYVLSGQDAGKFIDLSVEYADEK